MSYLYFSLEQISECLCYLCGIYFFTKASLTRNIKIYASVLVAFVVLVCCKGLVDISFYKAWVCTPFQMICLFFLIDGTIKSKVFYSVSAPVIAAFFNIIVIIFLDFDISANLHGQGVNYTWIVMLILIIIVGIIIKNIRYRKVTEYTRMPPYVYIAIIFEFLIFTTFIIWNYLYIQEFNSYKKNFFKMISVFSAIIFLTLVGFVYEVFIKLQEEKQKIKLMVKYEKIQKLYYENLLSNNKKIRGFKHDINNHLKCIYHFMKLEKYMEAEEYLEKIIGEFNEIGKSKFQCINYVVDAILNQFVLPMEKEKIEFEFQYDIYGELLIQEMDLSTILYNLLQNAVEECNRIKDGKRKICLQMKEDNGNVLIELKNTVHEDFNIKNIKNLKTTKKKQESHGFGIANVRDCIKKYNGELEYQYGQGEVSANIILFHATKN